MPDVTGLGAYTESGHLASVELDGEHGEYSLGMYVDNFPAIASGRELGAYPKKLGRPRLYVDSDTVVGTSDHRPHPRRPRGRPRLPGPVMRSRKRVTVRL